MTPGSALLLPLYFAAFPAAGFKGREGRGEKADSKWRGALQVLESLLVTPGRSEQGNLGMERESLERMKDIGSWGRKGRYAGGKWHFSKAPWTRLLSASLNEELCAAHTHLGASCAPVCLHPCSPWFSRAGSSPVVPLL